MFKKEAIEMIIFKNLPSTCTAFFEFLGVGRSEKKHLLQSVFIFSNSIWTCVEGTELWLQWIRLKFKKINTVYNTTMQHSLSLVFNGIGHSLRCIYQLNFSLFTSLRGLVKPVSDRIYALTEMHHCYIQKKHIEPFCSICHHLYMDRKLRIILKFSV